MVNIPDAQVPQYVTDSAAFAIEAAIKDAIRLGLSWRLRPGTVGGIGAADPESVPITVDGDNAPLLARSMVGSVALGQRVWCLQVPPAGIYVMGVIGARVLVPTSQIYTNTGSTATWTRPAGLAYIDLTVSGGGGGSGGAVATAAGESSMGGGGGGGATARLRIAAALLPATVTVTVGAGGTAGAATAGVSAGTGGTSSFGTLVTAGGGTGGVCRAASAVSHGIEGGTGSNTIGGTLTALLHSGTAGAPGWGSDNGLGISGTGGASHLGGGAVARRTTAAGQGLAGNNGRTYGGGASGSINSGGTAARVGAVGAQGIVIVEEYYN